MYLKSASFKGSILVRLFTLAEADTERVENGVIFSKGISGRRGFDPDGFFRYDFGRFGHDDRLIIKKKYPKK